jgi:hypothetical protein
MKPVPVADRNGFLASTRSVFVEEDRVRTNDFQDKAFHFDVAGKEPRNRLITERDELAGGFEPFEWGICFLCDSELLSLKVLSLPCIFLIGQKISNPEPRQIVEFPVQGSRGFLKGPSLESCVLSVSRGSAIDPGE